MLSVNQKFLKNISLFLLLNIIVLVLFEYALFYQLTPEMKQKSFGQKLAFTELFATIEWFFLIPAIRVGNTFLSAVQISLASFVFIFLGQFGTNTFLLKIPTTIDDQVAMLIIFCGILISTFRLFG